MLGQGLFSFSIFLLSSETEGRRAAHESFLEEKREQVFSHSMALLLPHIGDIVTTEKPFPLGYRHGRSAATHRHMLAWHRHSEKEKQQHRSLSLLLFKQVIFLTGIYTGHTWSPPLSFMHGQEYAHHKVLRAHGRGDIC